MADDAPYLHINFWRDAMQGSSDIGTTKWAQTLDKFDGSRDDDNFKTYQGKPVQLIRVIRASLPINNPLVKKANPRKIQMIVERTDETL